MNLLFFLIACADGGKDGTGWVDLECEVANESSPFPTGGWMATPPEEWVRNPVQFVVLTADAWVDVDEVWWVDDTAYVQNASSSDVECEASIWSGDVR